MPGRDWPLLPLTWVQVYRQNLVSLCLSHLVQKEWILEQLTRLYDCQEEEIPELEIDVDELLDMESDDTRAARVKELLVDCYKPTEAFISGLLDKIRGMQKLSTPQKK
ncbi:Protein phosphatase 1 regulatory subunit 14B, partial [Eschrichtius robustus]|nr:Protein phosphatase 1 regulatory subunit 14B [Eschrichtius robustus]